MSESLDHSLAELMIVASARLWRDDGEVLATGIGTGPRLAAGLARLAYNNGLMLTDGEAYLVEEPIPLGARPDGYRVKASGWMTYERVFDCLWHGRRHALVMPTQIDRFGQANISWLGDDYARPKTQLLGARGFPGNSTNHANSFFVSGHGKRTFVDGEVDMVCTVGYNPARRLPGMKTFVDLRSIVTDLCVMDFGGPDHAIRVRSLHPGVSFDEVQDATGFPLLAHPELGTTAAPAAEDLRIVRALDPHNLRATIVRNNPAPRRG
ncbi:MULTISPECIES: CoA-transferase subunit beta [unclassified Burkholderia]|uniref:CoA-transferase subunit beta n=1 Tax=unclassified Burkholderia TaxID=2613784 RepID=UPI001E2C4CA8|nr:MULTISPECIES: ketoacid CoA transferase [unclassified Burkholderia]UEP31632.1 ketoacid CoA transferase [Burkholderia sp. B21-007]UEP43123.1 ketoacid CoA transferase [Burkholderia sp. B21-005]